MNTHRFVERDVADGPSTWRHVVVIDAVDVERGADGKGQRLVRTIGTRVGGTNQVAAGGFDTVELQRDLSLRRDRQQHRCD